MKYYKIRMHMTDNTNNRSYFFCGSPEMGEYVKLTTDWTSFDLAEVTVTENRAKEIVDMMEIAFTKDKFYFTFDDALNPRFSEWLGTIS